MNKSRRIWHGFAFIGVIAACVAVVMLLWNALIPSVIGWTAINYWQAAGLLILSRLLFGGFGHFGHGRGFFHHQGHDRLHEKMKGMSFNERRAYIRKHIAEFNGFDETDRPSNGSEGKKNNE